MLTKADEKLIHALKSRRGREKHELFLVEGVRVVEDLLASGFDLEFAVVATTLGDNQRGSALKHQLARTTSVREVDEHKLGGMTDTDTSQGVLAVARIRDTQLDAVTLSARGTVLVLDAVQDPGNLGTLIRSADAFGCAAVVALPGTTDYWSPKVIRSAAGSAFRVPLVRSDETQLWEWLAHRDVAICGADMQGMAIERLQLNGRVSLVVGNEGAGLRPETRQRLTHVVSIPMQGTAESLNVAVAAGILLYEFSQRR